MKKFLFCVSAAIIISCSTSSYPQLIFEENFIYPIGTLTQVSGGKWVEFPTGILKVQVLEGSLSYPSYISSGSGNHIYLNAHPSIQGAGVKRSIQSVNSGTFYVSFLMMVQDTLDLGSGMNFFTFLNSYEAKKGYLQIRKSPAQNKINLGLYKNSLLELIYSTKLLDIMEPILIVMRYKFISGSSSNDSLNLWINPLLTQNEPAPDITIYSGNDITDINAITFGQNANAGNIFIDGVRVSKSWGEAPLPVEISSFTADCSEDKIILKWRTETEIDNYGFDIERRIVSEYKNEEWKKIAFIPGSGNSNSPKHYSFTDPEVYNFCSYYYRLKQIDNDGAFSYEKELNVQTRFPAKFTLHQNYPNPFNSGTSLRFSLPEPGNTSLVMYNSLGEEVIRIFSSLLSAGDHEVKFSADNLSSGNYFLVLYSGSYLQCRKITVLK